MRVPNQPRKAEEITTSHGNQGQVTDWLAGCRRDEAGKHTRGSAAANESQARETQTPLGAAGYLRRTE
jgi:hypothetical protein